MVLKLLLLAAAACCAWILTRPRPPSRPGGNLNETPMVQCKKCGVYHPAEDSCQCENGGGNPKS
ncbi:MAG: hypothetical protein ACR2P5_02695 [Gammaproteobacteria bacterium]